MGVEGSKNVRDKVESHFEMLKTVHRGVEASECAIRTHAGGKYSLPVPVRNSLRRQACRKRA